MADWYTTDSDEAQERLHDAWPDAPLDRLEVCTMLLEVAQEQVIAYAPEEYTPAAAPDADPFTVTGDAGTYTLIRGVARVFVTIRSSGVQWAQTYPAPGEMPAAFTPADYLDTGSPNGQAGFYGGAGGIYLYNQQDITDPFEWTYEYEAGGTSSTPTRFVYAQLQQAVNLWNAGRVSSDGTVGAEPFSFTPRPLDKTIRQIIRPLDGKPHVL